MIDENSHSNMRSAFVRAANQLDRHDLQYIYSAIGKNQLQTVWPLFLGNIKLLDIEGYDSEILKKMKENIKIEVKNFSFECLCCFGVTMNMSNIKR